VNLLPKCIDAIEKLLWPAERLSSQTGLHMTEESKARGCQIRAVMWVRNTDDFVLGDKFVRHL
jgi:hypothetical protein